MPTQVLRRVLGLVLADVHQGPECGHMGAVERIESVVPGAGVAAYWCRRCDASSADPLVDW